MIRLSAGTAAVLGLKKLKVDAFPTTAYAMIGERCMNNCAFCVRARESKAHGNMLSRVSWYEVPEEEAIRLLKDGCADGAFERVCIQVVNDKCDGTKVKELISELSGDKKTKVSISGGVETVEDAEGYFKAGADRIGIALDAAAKEVYEKIKGGSFEKKLRLIKDCAEKFHGSISTHLIAGLGETEKEIIKVMSDMYDWGVEVGLFAFTPLKGTGMENCNPPEISSYRQIQAARYLLKNKKVEFQDFVFCEGKLISITGYENSLYTELADGEAFRTSGCSGCNRPYYNEKPGGVIYNYPRELTREEIDECTADLRQNLT